MNLRGVFNKLGGNAASKQGLREYFLGAQWFRSFVLMTQTATMGGTMSTVQKVAQIAREEVTKDFGGSGKPPSSKK